MTAKKRLHGLVESMSERDAEALLEKAEKDKRDPLLELLAMRRSASFCDDADMALRHLAAGAEGSQAARSTGSREDLPCA